MEIHPQLILTACIVYFGLTSAQPDNQTVDQVGETTEFQNLFDSIVKNDANKSEIYNKILKQKVMEDQQVFDAMNEELWIARNQNVHKKVNFRNRGHINENVMATKRETNESNHKNDFQSPRKMQGGSQPGGKFHILLLNGPNLNRLGSREPHKYGNTTLADIVTDLSNLADTLETELSHFQSNAEHELIDRIHQADGNTDFIIINAAAYTHTSIALRDALLSVNIPFIEVHITNVHAREKFRCHSYLSDIAVGVICGFGADGYRFALQKAVKLLSKSR